MVVRNVPSITPQRRFPPYVPPPPPPPPPSRDREGSIALRQRAATQARDQNRTAAKEVLQRNFARNQNALFGPEAVASRTSAPGPTPGPGPGPAPAPVPVARTPRLEDFAVPDYRDAEYNAQIAALDRALRDFETGAQQRAERYGIDYLQGVRNIGYRPAPGFVAMPNILEAAQDESAPMAARAITGAEEPDATAGMQGQWDIEGRFDPYSAAARGTRGLRDEFAARGTLRSSDFGQTFGEFQNRLNEQLEAMETGRTRFAEDLASELAQQRAGTEERRQAAARAGQQRAVTERMNAFMRALAGG